MGYLGWIREQDCVSCGSGGPSEAHHFKGDLHLSGVGMRAPKLLTMPLCLKCHRIFHDNPPTSWREDQRAWLIKTINSAARAGVISYNEGVPF